MEWDKLASDGVIEKTSEELRKRGFEVILVENKEEARKKVLELVPKGAEVMHVSSTTLGEIGITRDIVESGEYDELGTKIRAVKDEKERNAMRKKILSPNYVIGSVQAVTENGQVVIASASGSQIPPYVFGATSVIWVVGTQKIVRNLDDALKRIYDYTLQLESERVRKAYNMPGSSVNKILLFEKERPGRIKLILVKERLGF